MTDCDRLAAEDAHQVVLEGKEEAGRAGVALAAGAAAQLVVDAARFVPLGTDDVEAAESCTPSPSTMSVPRPAMLVAMVTAPCSPACGDDRRLRARYAWRSEPDARCRASSSSCATLRSSRSDRADQHRLALSCSSSTSSAIALNLASSVL